MNRKTISHYRILEKLGEGGMGVVYKAEDTRLDRSVALKFLPENLSRDEEGKERFIHEAKAASALDHPNICTIHEIDQTDDGQLFVVMACYEGETLKEKVEKRPLKIDDALDIAVQISQGLLKAHDKGIIHRDIKPSNIFVTKDGIVKIIDFGLAKLTGKTILTKDGSTLGTVNFMSPEQVKGLEVDRRTDIWALGVVMYEMLTGQMPFKGDYDQSIFYSILNEFPEPVTSLRTGVPVEFERIINKALAKNPDERYQHIDELIVDLKHVQQIRESYSFSGQTYAPARKTEIKKFIIPAALLVILIIIFLLLRPFILEDTVVAKPKPIAIIAFTNQTGNASYDYLREAIPNLLITSLEQSKYLRVMTWERMNDVLKQMGKGKVGEINKDIGFELCRHEGINSIVIGSFVKAGNIFVTDVKVLDVNTKELLKSASVKGNGVQSILSSQIDQLSKEIARGVGLSKTNLESAPVQIAEVTTKSMDAYNFFLRGREEYEKIYYKEALRFLNSAVAIDTTFALAYFYIAKTCSSLLDDSLMVKAIEKAKVLSSRAPEKERLAIESLYAGLVERNSGKRLTLLEELVKLYPREKRFHNDLGVVYQSMNKVNEAQLEFEKAIELDPNFAAPTNGLAYIYAAQGLFDKAIETQKRYAALSPGDANPFDSMGEIYFYMGNFQESIAKYREALRVQPSFFISYSSLAYLYAFSENYSECFQYMDKFLSAAPTGGMKVWAMCWKSILLNSVGRAREASRENELIANLVRQLKNDNASAQYHWVKACNAMSNNNYSMAREEFDAFQKFFSKDNPQTPVYNITLYNILIANIFLQQGTIDSAKSYYVKIKSNLNKIESDRGILVMLGGILESEILLAEDQPEDAVKTYRATPLIKRKLSYGLETRLYNYPVFKDVVPRAFIRMGDLESAIIEYEKLLKFNPNSNDRRLINPIYHYRLAKLCERTAKHDKAKSEYTRFLELWEYADKDQPALIDAKRRLAKLTN